MKSKDSPISENLRIHTPIPRSCLRQQRPANGNVKTPVLAPGKHFERVMIVVLENSNYTSAMSDQFLSKLASREPASVIQNLYHPSYPNYLAMIRHSFGTRSTTK